MDEIVIKAIQATSENPMAFCKFLSANDTGQTGGHQAGIYISKPSIHILFDEAGIKGENKEKWATILWQDSFETQTRFIYYGQGTRNEYRITNFGRGFPYLNSDYTGALFILVKTSEEYYKAFILNHDNEIEDYLDAFGLSPAETNRLIQTGTINNASKELLAMNSFISHLTVEFPSSKEMSSAAREIVDSIHRPSQNPTIDPDRALLEWTDSEFRLFRYLENLRYNTFLEKGFKDVDSFLDIANQVLNRRKSRAGKSLENHLSALFDINGLQYSSQAVTEGNKKPDFLFPSISAYHDPTFPTSNLISLAAKTTCKDRWRQIINEADRLRDDNKYLCTLQQGISTSQMNEMEKEKVILVVPKPYISSFPKNCQSRIWTIKQFIEYAKEKTEL